MLIGAIGTVIYGMVALDEPVTILRILCIVLIVTGVVGLNLLHAPTAGEHFDAVTRSIGSE